MGHFHVTGYPQACAKAQDLPDLETNERAAYFGETFVPHNVLYGTFIATPEVHSHGPPRF
jgi:hypothetical protein